MILSRQVVRGLQRRALGAPQLGDPRQADPSPAIPTEWAAGPYRGQLVVRINR